MPLPNLKSTMQETALEAGKAIMEIYNSPQNKIEYKNDNSPVTLADKKAEAIITKALKERYKNIPIIAEEAASTNSFCLPEISNSKFFLVDALDGTKEFIRKRTDFTVNIALIEHGTPIAGIVYAPAHKTAWICSNGKAEKINFAQNGAEQTKTTINVRETNKNGPQTAIISFSHSNKETEDYLENFNITKRLAAGSSIKFCLIAEGRADIYPRFGRTMEWDTAAGDAVLRAAGGRVVQQDNLTALQYGKINQSHDADFANPFFIADNIKIKT